MTDFRKLCISLLIAIDSGNAKAENHVLTQIRAAVEQEERYTAQQFFNGDEK